MSEERKRALSYLGDGVYAEFDGDGIWLRTGTHEDHLCDNRIYLEPAVIYELTQFLAICNTLRTQSA